MMNMSKMNHSGHNDSSHYIVMAVIMIISGLLSTMNIWVDKINDIRFSVNDVYMTLLMTGWMLLFMGIYYNKKNVTIIGLLLVIVNIWCIRTQFLVNEEQYKLGMIPHHSMAVHMSKKLLDKNDKISINEFVKNIINTQEKEIKILKE